MKKGGDNFAQQNNFNKTQPFNSSNQQMHYMQPQMMMMPLMDANQFNQDYMQGNQNLGMVDMQVNGGNQYQNFYDLSFNPHMNQHPVMNNTEKREPSNINNYQEMQYQQNNNKNNGNNGNSNGNNGTPSENNDSIADQPQQKITHSSFLNDPSKLQQIKKKMNSLQMLLNQIETMSKQFMNQKQDAIDKNQFQVFQQKDNQIRQNFQFLVYNINLLKQMIKQALYVPEEQQPVNQDMMNMYQNQINPQFMNQFMMNQPQFNIPHMDPMMMQNMPPYMNNFQYMNNLQNMQNNPELKNTNDMSKQQ